MEQITTSQSKLVINFSENKLEFIMSYVDYKVNKQLMEQTKAFRNGFVKIVHRNWLQMFNHD